MSESPGREAADPEIVELAKRIAAIRAESAEDGGATLDLDAIWAQVEEQLEGNDS